MFPLLFENGSQKKNWIASGFDINGLLVNWSELKFVRVDLVLLVMMIMEKKRKWFENANGRILKLDATLCGEEQ